MLSKRPIYLKQDKTSRKISESQLRKLIKNNVIELIFKRKKFPIKNPDSGQKTQYRRILFTQNWKFLKINRALFKYKGPKGIRPRGLKWYQKRNLIIGWDLIRKQYRIASLDYYRINAIRSIKTIQEQTEFIEYYKDNISTNLKNLNAVDIKTKKKRILKKKEKQQLKKVNEQLYYPKYDDVDINNKLDKPKYIISSNFKIIKENIRKRKQYKQYLKDYNQKLTEVCCNETN